MENILLENETLIENVHTLQNIKQVNKNTKLYYELGYKINMRLSVDNNNWVRTGHFKEIKNPLEFVLQDKNMKEKSYLKHHNFKFTTNYKNI